MVYCKWYIEMCENIEREGGCVEMWRGLEASLEVCSCRQRVARSWTGALGTTAGALTGPP